MAMGQMDGAASEIGPLFRRQGLVPDLQQFQSSCQSLLQARQFPLDAVVGGVGQVVGYDLKSLGGWDIASGRRLWSVEIDASNGYTVPTPLDLGGRLLVADGPAEQHQRLPPYGQAETGQDPSIVMEQAIGDAHDAPA